MGAHGEGMAKTRVRYRLEHEGGASDEVYETFSANVPRVGEFVSVGVELTQLPVFDVNWKIDEDDEIAVVWLTCRGKNEYCEWDCDYDRESL